MIAINRPESLDEMITIAIRIDNRQYEKYVDKKTDVKIHPTKRFSKKDLMKLNVTKIKKLRIKNCYFCEKKNHLKRNCPEKIIKATKK